MIRRMPPAVLGSLILLLFASLMGLVLAGRPDPAVLAHPDVQALAAETEIVPGWKTVVLFSERETGLPAAALQSKIAEVTAWPDWSRSALKRAEKIDNSEAGTIWFRIDAFYGWLPIEYAAPVRHRAADRLIWGRVQMGAATLFAWRVTPTGADRSRVSLTAYLDAPAYGALRALLEAEGQAEVDRIVTHLLTAAR